MDVHVVVVDASSPSSPEYVTASPAPLLELGSVDNVHKLGAGGNAVVAAFADTSTALKVLDCTPPDAVSPQLYRQMDAVRRLARRALYVDAAERLGALLRDYADSALEEHVHNATQHDLSDERESAALELYYGRLAGAQNPFVLSAQHAFFMTPAEHGDADDDSSVRVLAACIAARATAGAVSPDDDCGRTLQQNFQRIARDGDAVYTHEKYARALLRAVHAGRGADALALRYVLTHTGLLMPAISAASVRAVPVADGGQFATSPARVLSRSTQLAVALYGCARRGLSHGDESERNLVFADLAADEDAGAPSYAHVTVHPGVVMPHTHLIELYVPLPARAGVAQLLDFGLGRNTLAVTPNTARVACVGSSATALPMVVFSSTADDVNPYAPGVSSHHEQMHWMLFRAMAWDMVRARAAGAVVPPMDAFNCTLAELCDDERAEKAYQALSDDVCRRVLDDHLTHGRMSMPLRVLLQDSNQPRNADPRDPSYGVYELREHVLPMLLCHAVFVRDGQLAGLAPQRKLSHVLHSRIGTGLFGRGDIARAFEAALAARSPAEQRVLLQPAERLLEAAQQLRVAEPMRMLATFDPEETARLVHMDEWITDSQPRFTDYGATLAHVLKHLSALNKLPPRGARVFSFQMDIDHVSTHLPVEVAAAVPAPAPVNDALPVRPYASCARVASPVLDRVRQQLHVRTGADDEERMCKKVCASPSVADSLGSEMFPNFALLPVPVDGPGGTAMYHLVDAVTLQPIFCSHQFVEPNLDKLRDFVDDMFASGEVNSPCPLCASVVSDDVAAERRLNALKHMMCV